MGIKHQPEAKQSKGTLTFLPQESHQPLPIWNQNSIFLNFASHARIVQGTNRNKKKKESQIKQLSLIHHQHVFNEIKSCMMNTETGPRSYQLKIITSLSTSKSLVLLLTKTCLRNLNFRKFTPKDQSKSLCKLKQEEREREWGRERSIDRQIDRQIGIRNWEAELV